MDLNVVIEPPFEKRVLRFPAMCFFSGSYALFTGPANYFFQQKQL